MMRWPSLRGMLTAVSIAGIGCLLGAGSAGAQEIDYGSLALLFGEPVTDSATGVPQRKADVPVDMEILTADDIRRSGAKDIPGVLAHVTGIDVLPYTNSTTDVSIRGYDQPYSPRLLVLVDGRQVYLDYYGFTQWSAIPVQLEEIRQIEIIKGPNSALYGFNATGGVINIVTYNPLFDRVREGTVQGGTQDFTRGSAVVTQKIGDDFGLKLSAGGHAGDDFASLQRLAQQAGLPERTERGSISADAHWRITPNSTFELEASHVAANQLDVLPAYDLAYSKYDVNSILGRYSAQTPIGLVQATAYTNMSEQFSREPLFSAALDLKNQITVAQIQDIFQVGSDHTFRVGGEYRRNENNIVPLNAGSLSYDIAALSGAWTWKLSPDLSFTQAVRVDSLWLERTGPLPAAYPFTDKDFERNITVPSYNSGLVYRASEDDVLRMTAARGIQLPSQVQFGAIVLPNLAATNLTGNPAIQPAIVDNYEVQWESKIAPLESALKTSVFYQKTKDIQSILTGTYRLVSDGAYYTIADNVGNSREIGFELSLKGSNAAGWRWSAGYAPRLVQDHYRSGQTFAKTADDFEGTTPVHVVTASLGWTHGDLEADLFGRFVSDAIGYALNSKGLFTPRDIGAYANLDARLGYKATDRVTLALSGQNLALEHQRQTSVGQVDRRVLGSVTVAY